MYFRETITGWENRLQSSQENNTSGSHIDNGCYKWKLLDSKTETNNKERNQNLLWMQKIPYHTTKRHSSIRKSYRNQTFSSKRYKFCTSNHVLQQEWRWEKGIRLFTWSLLGATHLELLPNQTTDEFIRALKRFN